MSMPSKTVILGSLVFFGVLLGVLYVALDLEPSMLTLGRLKKFEQRFNHGEVRNLTNHSIRVTSYRYLHTVPVGETSFDVGVADADSIVIDRPTQIDGVVYKQGFFKFCDLGKMTVNSGPTFDFVTTNRPAVVCKWIGDYDQYDKLLDAFP